MRLPPGTGSFQPLVGSLCLLINFASASPSPCPSGVGAGVSGVPGQERGWPVGLGAFCKAGGIGRAGVTTARQKALKPLWLHRVVTWARGTREQPQAGAGEPQGTSPHRALPPWGLHRPGGEPALCCTDAKGTIYILPALYIPYFMLLVTLWLILISPSRPTQTIQSGAAEGPEADTASPARRRHRECGSCASVWGKRWHVPSPGEEQGLLLQGQRIGWLIRS